MSDIKTIDNKRVHGRIEKLEMISDSSYVTNNRSEFDAVVTITHDEIWTDCIICSMETYTKHRFMDEGICEACRREMISRIKLILDFQ